MPEYLEDQNIQVGDRIRAFDFRDNPDCYVEGTVLRIDVSGEQGFPCFVVSVDKDVWNPPGGFSHFTRPMRQIPFCVPLHSVRAGQVVNLSAHPEGATKTSPPTNGKEVQGGGEQPREEVLSDAPTNDPDEDTTDPDGAERPENTRLLDVPPDAPSARIREVNDPADTATELSGPAPDTSESEGIDRPLSTMRPNAGIRLVGLSDDFRDREWSLHGPFHVGRVPMKLPDGLTLDAPSAKSVSRLHATVSLDEVGWWVTDRSSTNGTFLNGTRLGEEGAGPLRTGDTIQFATAAVRIECAPQPGTRRADGEWPGGDGNCDGWLAAAWQAGPLLPAADFSRREYLLARCGCVRRFAHLFRPEHVATVERAERTADGAEPVHDPQSDEGDRLTELINALTDYGTRNAAYCFQLLELVGNERRAAEAAAQEAISRDVLGESLRAAEFDPRWRTPEVVGLARYGYESGDFSVMPILADALQDAGCDDRAVLDHCRADAAHVRGCWVVDEVLRHRSTAARFRQHGLIDPLTGVGNRRAYHAALTSLLTSLVLDGVSLLAVEIDSFARFDGTHPHPTGDRALAEVARRLGDALGGRGLLARPFGDGGFRILLPNAGRVAAFEAGERLRQEVEGRSGSGVGGDSEHTFTISVGAATAGSASLTRNTEVEARRLKGELEDAADRALQRAKAYGGNRVCTSSPNTRA